MKFFVTGGAGFIGGHVVAALLKSNNSVTIYDSFVKNTEEKITPLLDKGATLIKGDITDNESLNNALSNGFEVVIHLAAKTRVIDSINNPEETHHVNVTGTIRLLRACVKHDVKKIIAASSGAVYGDSKILPLSEELPAIPISPYGASKLSLEHYLQAFAHSYDLNCIALRFSNVYGEGQSLDYAGVITKFIDNIKNEKPLIIFGDGEQSRDFVSVDDIVFGIKKAVENIEGKKGNYYNIATGKNTSINDLAKMLLEISGKELEIIHENPKKGEIKHNYASIELARKELEYAPKVLLKDGLKNLMFH